jgi:hypothetical protein
VNKFIEGMNKSYRAKYKLLKQKKATLNDANRKRCEAYKAQETIETKGMGFVNSQICLIFQISYKIVSN